MKKQRLKPQERSWPQVRVWVWPGRSLQGWSLIKVVKTSASPLVESQDHHQLFPPTFIPQQ